MKIACQLLGLALLLLWNFALASDVLLTMNSYGPVKIGMTADEAYLALRSLSQVTKPAVSVGCDYYEAKPGVMFMTNDKRIVRIEVSSKDAVTPSGIKVGDNILKLKKTFGNRVSDEPQHYDGPEARTLKVFSRNGIIAMRFEVYDDRVREIYAGYEHSIHYVEGCS